MAARVEKIFTALDIGSSKITAMIAGRMDNGDITVLGTGQRASKGVKRGYIADTERTELDVRDAVEQAERIAGTNIDDIWVSFSAGGLTSMLTSVETELGGHRIEQEDIDHLLQAGRNSIDPQGTMVLHAQPALYKQVLQAAGFKPQYISVVSKQSLKPAKKGDTDLVILAAAVLGKTRLIDNLEVTLSEG